ncbi:MAG: DUF3892 domain-containing protein [Actinobacteria bacterium]|nr:DUF3892 domain-containing protein [Actinomycetota bacterium]
MEKWADFGITHVQYNEPETHIIKARVREDLGETFGDPEDVLRENVIAALETGVTLVTIIKKDKQWQKGSDVEIINVNGKKYIRTDANRQENDNLENLPRF